MDASTYGLPSHAKAGGVYGTESSRQSLAPLPPVLTHGLSAVATLGFVSFISSAVLFLYLTLKLVWWQLKPATFDDAQSAVVQNKNVDTEPGRLTGKKNTAFPRQPESIWHRLRKEPPNQFLILIYNLLFADIQQASAFLLNVQWLVKNGIFVDSSICWAQGWFVSTGDLASSVFVTTIAVHTYMGVVHDYRLPTWAFYMAIGLLWSLVYGLAILGVIVTKNGAGVGGFYVRAGAWCWINTTYQDLRLYIHYLWIFLGLGVTCVLYIVIVWHIQRRIITTRPDTVFPVQAHYPNPDPNAGADTVRGPAPKARAAARHPAFLLYPAIYVLCTAPLAAGRIATMAGRDISLAYFCFSGSMIASAGWLDVVLYSSTRRSIVFAGNAPPSQDTGLDTFDFMRTPMGPHLGNVVHVQGGRGGGDTSSCHEERKRWHGWGDKVMSCARLRGVGQPSSHSFQTGFGSSDGEGMGMAIQCDVVASVTVEHVDKTAHERNDINGDRVDDSASLNSRTGIIKSNTPHR